MLYFDSHFHTLNVLNRIPSYQIPETLIGIDVSTEPGDIKERIRLIKSPDIFISVGAGPWVLDSKDFKSVDDEIEKLENSIRSYGADAIGEYGFDNHWNYGDKEKQLDLFLKETELANTLEKVKIIHLRDADNEAENNLASFDEKTILHCYSSGPDLAKKIIERGSYFSFSGNITYKGNEKIVEALRLIPLDRLLYETDAPYLSPKNKRGLTNRMEFAQFILDFISTVRKIDRKKLKETVLDNFYRLFGYKKSIVRRQV